MKRILLGAIALVPLALAGCTETTEAMIEASKRPLHVTCFSGSTVILDDVSTKDVEWGSYGLMYRSRTTSRLVQAKADCVVVDEDLLAGWKPVLPGRTR